VSDPKISRRHLALRHTAGRVEVTDLGSTNGTRVDGALIHGTHVLVPGEVVEFGTSTVELWRDDGPPPAGGHGATSIDRIAADIPHLAVELAGALPGDSGTVTIVLSDIDVAPQRRLELGDERWQGVLDDHNAIVRRQVDRHRGVEVVQREDGFLLLFAHVRDTLACLIDVQRALHAVARSHPAHRVRARAGVHAGELIVDDAGEVVEGHAFVAALIAGAAHGDEILASNVVRQLAGSRDDVGFGPSRLVSLGGVLPRHRVHPVQWMHAPPPTKEQ